jgi:tetratricopeptide (TPR) repeat protein
MTTDPTDRELLDLLEVESEGTPRAEWARVLEDVRAEETQPAPSAGFDDALRARWQSELAAADKSVTVVGRPRPRRSFLLWPRLAMPLIAACVVAALVLFRPWGGPDGTPGRGSSAGVVWGDVIRAMQRVEHFHAIAFEDSPNSADTPPIIRLDVFHQQPDKWRAQALGHVSFATTGGKPRTWNVEKGAWTGSGDRDPDILPTDFIERHEKLGTLGAILAWFFDGKVPPGEPVKSDEVASGNGIDVFDYAKDASNRWLRIWVLRESKLPLKMHVYHPASDDFLLVTFDYSDPQPAAFFDADAFAKQASAVQGEGAFRERRIFSIGSRPVARTRPRGADQLFEAAGGYRAPKVSRVLSNADGDVMVVTDRPENKTPQGYRPHFAGYRGVTDNWGNTFIYAGGGGRSAGERWMFMPLPPAKLSGPSPRQITLRYEVEGQYGDKPLVLKTETLDVPPPVAPAAGKKSDWPENFANEKPGWYRNHLRSTGTLEQQLAEVERTLAADPSDVDALAWKYGLMREYGRQPAAITFFETSLRDRVFNEPTLLGRYSTEASQYLLALAAQQRTDELRKWSDHVNQMVEKLRDDKAARRNGTIDWLVRKEHNPLYPATHLLEWRETYKDGPKVLRTVASKDGLVYVELEIPATPEGWQANGWSNDVPEGWFWRPWLADDAWQVVGRAENLKDRRLGLVLRGSGSLTLVTEAILQRDNYNVYMPQNDVKLPWRRTIEVPQPTADDMNVWTQQQGVNVIWFSPPSTQPASQPAPNTVQQWLDAVDEHRKAGRFAEALEVYGKVLAAPREQWPDMYVKGIGVDPDLVEGRKRRLRIDRAECLAKLGRFDEARAEAQAIRAALPEKPDLADPLQGLTAADALAADLHVARGLLKRGDAKGAEAELTRIAARRPDLQDLPDGTVMIPRGEGTKFGWSPRYRQRDAWRGFDAVWWDVRDALARK